MNTNRPQLTISLLASDRLDTLPRCLESLKPIMEAIPCELILVDTSNNPKVRELLLQYTDQVFPFEWCNDFAKARNEGLLRAKGEWFMYLDDDEWFVETDAIIDFFRSGEYKNYGYANYQVRNFMDVNYLCYSDGWVSRMVKLDKDTRFVSKIHEYFSPIKKDRKDLFAMVHHSGYIYETPEKKKAHFERNVSLLLDMIAQEPEVIRWRLQLVQEYQTMGKWEEEEKCCRMCLEASADMDSEYISMHMATFYTGLVTALQRQEKHADAVQICREALADKRCREVLGAMMHLKMGENLACLEKWDDAIVHAHEYLECLQKIDRKRNDIIEQSGVLLVDDTFGENNQKVAYCVLVSSHLAKGNIQPLIEHYVHFGWNEKVIYTIANIEKYLTNAMWSMRYNPIWVRVMWDALQNKELRALFRETILLQENEKLNEFQQAIYRLLEAMQKVVDGPQKKDMEKYYFALQEYVQAVYQWYEFLGTEIEVELENQETPGYIQAALDITEYIELEAEDKMSALKKLKDAVVSLPDFADGLGTYIHNYAELEHQRDDKRINEMELLRRQVVAQVKEMIESGQKAESRQILQQLKQMYPDDEEILKLIEETI